MVNSPITDMLIRISNAQAVGKEQIWIPFSKMKFKIGQILKEGGWITEIEKKAKKAQKADLDYIFITLKYDQDKNPAISGFKIISKPSRHMYFGVGDIKSVRSGFGLGVISTSKGVMSSKEARKLGIGGEMLFEIW